ncbi:MAG: hypothetical protein U0V72_09520 [Cytophagales bacterium]
MENQQEQFIYAFKKIWKVLISFFLVLFLYFSFDYYKDYTRYQSNLNTTAPIVEISYTDTDESVLIKVKDSVLNVNLYRTCYDCQKLHLNDKISYYKNDKNKYVANCPPKRVARVLIFFVLTVGTMLIYNWKLKSLENKRDEEMKK